MQESANDKKAKALEELYQRIKKDKTLKSELLGSRLVPGEGCLSPRLLFIGEAPGKDEDRLIRPFVGAAGRNLDKLLSGADIARNEVFITNLVKFRPVSDKRRGKNRKPSKAESKAALLYLEEEVKIIKPKTIVCLGASSGEAILGRNIQMKRDNGKLFEWHEFKVFISLHPSPLNFNNPDKRKALEEAFEELRRLSRITE
ncbi:MAG TPA: uracil-DNA glycosylase [Candidatus Woesearchaeota archaeon]|nr:uracil-DNA glycosylase [Candidatus Woesearchaeota archaeon]